VLLATWRDGLFVVVGGIRGHELDDQSVRALAPDGHGGALAIVNGRSLRRRSPGGVWSTIATTEGDLACCVVVGDIIYSGPTMPAFCASAQTTSSPGARHGTHGAAWQPTVDIDSDVHEVRAHPNRPGIVVAAHRGRVERRSARERHLRRPRGA